jgi:hypothetical protein
MTGRKDSPVCRQNYRAQIPAASDFTQAVDQLLHERERKGVTPLRPIQGDQSDVAFGCEADILVTHPMILRPNSNRIDISGTFAEEFRSGGRQTRSNPFLGPVPAYRLLGN